MAILKYKNANNEWELVDTLGAIKYLAQILTEEQKAQARENIGAVSSEYVENNTCQVQLVVWGEDD